MIRSLFWVVHGLWLFESWDLLHLHSLFPAVVSVIDENIKLCRRLIIIIVPEALSLDLLRNMSEEQIAVYNALIQDGIKVILIELGKMKDYTALPESLQYIRQKHGAIQWSGDFTEQSLCAKTKFWKKVRYRMPPKRWPPSSSVQLLKHTPCDLTAGKREANMGFITLWWRVCLLGWLIVKQWCITFGPFPWSLHLGAWEKASVYWLILIRATSWGKDPTSPKAPVSLLAWNMREYLLSMEY